MKRKWLVLVMCACLSFSMTSIAGADTLEETAAGEVQAADETDIVEDTEESLDEAEIEDADDTQDFIDMTEEEPQEVPDADDEQALASGWQQEADGAWKYYEGKTCVTGLKTINGKTYLFNADNGRLESGICDVNGVVYYFSEEQASPEEGYGALVKNSWVRDLNDSVHYINDAGTPLGGWQTIGSDLYYFDPETYAMETGLTEIGGRTFYLTEDGAMSEGLGAVKIGWQTIDGVLHYFKWSGAAGVKGAMFKGWQNLGKKTFYFDPETGALAKGGWTTIGSKTYYFKRSGKPGTIGQLFTGWVSMSGKTYYFLPAGRAGNKGAMYTGWHYIDKKAYCFKGYGAAGDKGQLYTGWRTISKQVYYFEPSGANGVKGVRKTGWQTIGGKKFYFKTSGGLGVTGRMYTGFQKIGSKTYFFKRGGANGIKGAMLTGWQKVDGSWYFLDANGVMKTGWMSKGGYWYYLDTANGKMASGWTYVPSSKGRYSSYKFYFRPSKSGSAPAGSLVQDVSSIIGRQSSYYTEVDRSRCTVVVYAKNENGEYRIPVKTMTCSVGLPGTPTPAGTFNTLAKYRWKELMGPSWGQYATRIVGGVLFHSVAGSHASSYNLSAGNYNMLGQPASHGCVRLCVRDAKWIYDNCSLGMTVRIGDGLYQPFDKPATIKIPASQNWDPTDPNV